MSASQRQRTSMAAILKKLSLLEYEQALEENGFDTSEALMEIQEGDMQRIKMKLGHRRKLQREIDTVRGQQGLGHSRSSGRQSSTSVADSPASSVTTRRGPVWRPRLIAIDTPQPDPKAPEKPVPAYSKFRAAVQAEAPNKSIMDVSRTASERWTALSLEEQIQGWLKPYAKALQEYETLVGEYKETDEYRQYQRYLEGYDREHRSRYSDSASMDRSSPFRTNIDTQLTTANERQGAVPSADDERALQADKAICALGGDIPEGTSATLNPSPTQETTMLAVTSFFTGTGQRFFLWNSEEALAMVESMFDQNVGTGDSWTAMEVAAIAAIGTCCDADCFPQVLQRHFHTSCVQSLRICTGEVDLRLMRLILSLSLYCTLDQPLEAHNLVYAALAIGRLMLQQRKCTATMSYQEENDWRKVWRTAVFMESWLHYGLSFPLNLTHEDIQSGCQEIAGVDSTLENMIQYQISKVGLLAVDVAVDVRSRDRPNVEEIKAHMEKMEVWYRQLPAIMRISTLNSAQAEIFTHFQKRSVLLVHMLCLGAVTLLHRPLLVTIAQSRYAGIWDLEDGGQDCRALQDYCSIAAQQASRIAAVLQFDKTMPKRCWIAIFQSFSACSILLFSASQKLLYGSFGAFEDDLSYADNFLKLLSWCAAAEPIAHRCLEIVSPIITELKKLAEGFYYIEDHSLIQSGSNAAFSGSMSLPGFILGNDNGSSSLSDTQSMAPPPTPSQVTPVRRPSRASEETRQEIISLVQQISRLLLDPYSMVYNTKNPHGPQS